MTQGWPWRSRHTTSSRPWISTPVTPPGARPAASVRSVHSATGRRLSGCRWITEVLNLDGMVATPSIMLPLGTEAPDFALPDPSGTIHRRDDFADAPAL